jgi:hypothetical protein
MNRILLLLLLFSFSNSYNQSNSEILTFLNMFENVNAVERYAKGKFKEKVSLEYKDGNLIINSFIYLGKSTPGLVVRSIIKISDITRIEASKEYYNNMTYVDFYICAKPGSINIQEQERYNSRYKTWSNESLWFKKNGYCDSEIRLKFPSDIADSQIDRVYNALEALAKNHGAKPKIGSLF